MLQYSDPPLWGGRTGISGPRKPQVGNSTPIFIIDIFKIIGIRNGVYILLKKNDCSFRVYHETWHLKVVFNFWIICEIQSSTYFSMYDSWSNNHKIPLVLTFPAYFVQSIFPAILRISFRFLFYKIKPKLSKNGRILFI